jgi:hypothetical protein
MARTHCSTEGDRGEVRTRAKHTDSQLDCAASLESTRIRFRIQERGTTMGTHWSARSAIILAFAALAACPTELRAQDASGSTPEVPQQAAAVLTGDQQSAANSALCLALGSHFPNIASVSPSALSDPAVMSTAASSFAGSTSLPLPGATDLLKGYVTQHASDILASCAANNATGGLNSKLPGASSLPSIPQMP